MQRQRPCAGRPTRQAGVQRGVRRHLHHSPPHVRSMSPSTGRNPTFALESSHAQTPPPSPHPLRRRLSTHARVLSVPEFPHLPKVGPRQQWQSLAPRHEQTVERGGGGSQPSVGRLVQQHTSISNAVHGVVCRQPHHGREPIAWLRPASTLTPSKSTHSVYIWLKAERVVARACHGLVAPLCRPCHST